MIPDPFLVRGLGLGTRLLASGQGVVTPICAILTDATGVTVWSRGHRRLLGVVTGSPKDFWCGHRVTEGFLVRSQGRENFSPLSHGVTEQCCAEQSRRTSHVHPMVPQVPSSSAAHALSESILYDTSKI